MKPRTFRVRVAREHRFLVVRMLWRSRYGIANRARVNEPENTNGLDEICGRFYEGAAASAATLDVAPDADDLPQPSDWPESVLTMPSARRGVTTGCIDSKLSCRP